MSEPVLDVVKRENELQKRLKALDTRNLVLTLNRDFVLPSGKSVGKILKVQAIALEMGAFYFVLRNDQGELSFSTKTGIQNIDHIERDPTDYPKFLIGGGHPQ